MIVQVVTRPATEDIDAPDLIHPGLTGQGFQPAEMTPLTGVAPVVTRTHR
ncbi:hypothetical protein A6P39_041040 [Streptomyces sp. FXJ1.172]|nr:hypothetical protein [Streptomyces sp. FXJ1.172]WEO99908.1 hypothetical protein A6P39_041040 [Streptomyces sp. FXJ1.172]